MFLLESNIGIIILETVISVYLFSTYNDVQNGKEGNILKHWEDKIKERKCTKQKIHFSATFLKNTTN
jgi:competence transcription factor ComK